MGDTIDDLKALGHHSKALRKTYGVTCPQCAVRRPKANPSILLPQQRCRVDGYIDPRPELTNEQWSNA
jgi:hypothetical protein